MRFDVNLASQPYEDAARFYRRWLLALVVVTGLSAVLLWAAVTSWRTEHQANRRVREFTQTLAQLNKNQRADEAILNRPENQDVREQGEFLNAVIRRKAFSWTQVFSELERIMPGGLRVVSIKPEMTPDNQLAIHMMVAGNSRDRGLELMRRMEQSKSFRQTALINENATATGADTMQFEINALYTPQPVASASMPSSAPQAQARAAALEGGRR